MNIVRNTVVRAWARTIFVCRPWRSALEQAVFGLIVAGLLPGLSGSVFAQPRAELPSGGYELAGRVVRVADGDTLTLLVNGGQQKVRLASIDAPEVTKDARQPGQPYAQASRESLADMVAGKNLVLRCYERDRYKRNICDVPLPDGDTANRRQVARGMAWANMEGRGRYMRDDALPRLQEHARRQRLGLWQDRDPVRPWQWRYQCWRQKQCQGAHE
ncbi:thermonuclease family protein [Paracandidimonas lactea]|uniref:thermonuclease family protein n=1 Tax=Paracandidimonas lactea TaxID=2895524 RepID=UPI001F1630D1